MNRTGGFTASGSRTRRHAFTHDGPRPSWVRRTSPNVQSGGTINGALIFNGGFGSVEAGGTSLNTDVEQGAQLDVYGSASATLVEIGRENIFAGGVDSSSTVRGGEQHVYGTAVGAFVTSTTIFQEIGPSIVLPGQQV